MKTIQQLAEEYISEQEPAESDEIYNILTNLIRKFSKWADSQAPQEKPEGVIVGYRAGNPSTASLEKPVCKHCRYSDAYTCSNHTAPCQCNCHYGNISSPMPNNTTLQPQPQEPIDGATRISDENGDEKWQPQEKPSELCVKGGYFGCLCKKCIQDLKELAEKHFPEKPVCIYCKKEVNQMIEPWGYFFPSQIFHTGCKIAHTGHPIESPQPQEPVYRSAPHPSTTIEPQEPPKKIDLLPEVFTNNFGETEMMNMSSPERLKINEIVKYLNDHVSK